MEIYGLITCSKVWVVINTHQHRKFLCNSENKVKTGEKTRFLFKFTLFCFLCYFRNYYQQYRFSKRYVDYEIKFVYYQVGGCLKKILDICK